jgi:LacI family transcriptional regulator
VAFLATIIGNVPNLKVNTLKQNRNPANILDVARKAGVSKSTTARVLSGTGAVSGRARDKVIAAAAALRYRVNASARTLRQGKNRLLAAVFPSGASRGVISHAIGSEKLEGLARGAERLKYDLQIFFADLNDAAELRRLAMEKSIGGFLFTGGISPVTLELLDRYEIPWVGINWCNVNRPNDPHCWTDFAHGGRTLMTHLYQVGCRKVVAFDWLSASYGPFGTGVRDAWKDLGMPAHALELHVGGHFNHGPDVNTVLDQAMNENRPDGFLMSSEAGAMCAYRAIRARGLEPGKDVAVATFDDLGTASHMDPPCTAYKQPTYEMGEAAVEELDRVLSGERGRKIERNIRGTLLERGSSLKFSRPQG